MVSVGFDAKRAFNNNTGLGNYSRFIIEAWLQAGHQAHSYTPKLSKSFLIEEPYQDSHSVITPNVSPLLHAYWRSYGVVSDLKRDGIRVFHGLSNELPHGLRRANIASVVTIHDLIFKRYPALYQPIDRFLYDQKSRYACQNADAIVAVSAQTKRDIMAFYGVDGQKIKVIYQDCHANFRRVCTDEQKQAVAQKYNLSRPYVLCVGTLEPRKNQERLIDAFYQVFCNQDIDLVLVGNGPKYQQKLVDIISVYGIESQVKILNQVPFDDLPVLYQLARVFAYLSVFEGFGIPIVEALHSGVPVLAAQGSCLEEAGGGGGRYVNPDDEYEIAEALTQLWHEEPLRQQLITNGRAHVVQFAAPTIAHQLAELYHGITR